MVWFHVRFAWRYEVVTRLASYRQANRTSNHTGGGAGAELHKTQTSTVAGEDAAPSLFSDLRTHAVHTDVRTYVGSVETYVSDAGGLPNGTNKDAEGQEDAGSHIFTYVKLSKWAT